MSQHPNHFQSDAAWLVELCLSRTAFALIFTVYSAAIPVLVLDWSMSAAQAGLVQSAWHVGYLVSLFSIGFLADRYGAKRLFLLASITAAASALLFAFFADGFWSATLLYGLTGLCSGGSYTPGLTLISERFPTGRGRAMGFFLAAASVGYAASLLLTGALTPFIGWRGAFIVTACGPLLGMVLALHGLRQTSNVVHPAPPPAERAHPISEVLGNRPAMLTIWAYAFHSWELLGLKAWLPAFLAAAAHLGGASVVAAASLGAMLTGLTYFASALGSIAGGSLSDRKGRTWTMLFMSFGSLACSFGLGWMLALPLWFIVAVASLHVFMAIGDSSVYSTAITELVPPRLIGAAYSVRSAVGFGAGAISPWVLGLVLDTTHAGGSTELTSWGLAWTSLGVGALLGPLVTWRLRQLPDSRRMAGGKR